MEKVVQIDEQSVRVRMSADTLRVYRRTFGRDLIVDMNKMTETMDMEVIENLLYIAAKAADPELPEIDEWLAQFTPFAIYQSAAQVLQAWNEENQTLSKPKKKVTR